MYRLILLFFAVFFLESCLFEDSSRIQLPRPDYSVWIRYLPETDHVAQERLEVRPVPMDNGWTDQRMERDLKRMVFCGIDTIMLEMTPRQLSDDEMLERMQSFLSAAALLGRKVVLSLVNAPNDSLPMELERENLLQYLETFSFGNSESYLCRSGKPVVLIADGFSLPDAEDSLSESILLLRFGKELPACPKAPLEQSLDMPAPSPAKFQWVRAGQCSLEGSSPHWLIPRQRGKALRLQFENLRRNPCEVVLLSSWNDYHDGSFVEGNSLDGEIMTKTVKSR